MKKFLFIVFWAAMVWIWSKYDFDTKMLNLIYEKGVDIGLTISFLGFCLLRLHLWGLMVWWLYHSLQGHRVTKVSPTLWKVEGLIVLSGVGVAGFCFIISTGLALLKGIALPATIGAFVLLLIKLGVMR